MIDDMEALDGLSGSSDDGNIQSQLFALNTDVLGQIAMFLKPADVYSLLSSVGFGCARRSAVWH